MTEAKEISSQEKLVQAATRLERLLSNQPVKPMDQDAVTDAVIEAATTLIHSNPSKIVKRWLGTSSGTAANADLADVSFVAKTMLNPLSTNATGRDLLMQLSPTPEEMQTDADEAEPKYLEAAACEVESYLLSLAIRILFRNNESEKALELSIKAIQITNLHMAEMSKNTYGVGSANGLYPLLSRLFRFQSLVAESCAPGYHLEQGKRGELVNSHRLAVIRRDVDTQATLLNIMLRDLLNANQGEDEDVLFFLQGFRTFNRSSLTLFFISHSKKKVEQAQKLLENSSFPETASNNQLCRHLYYSGRIQALRLEYTSAFSNLSQCLRKAPTNTAIGFRIAVQRLLVVVQLLMGEIPERSVFFSENMVGELAPYLKITQAVRHGDLAVFHDTVKQFTERLKSDGTYTLISRLAHSVVKAGLRRLNTSYSRISLDDIANRLGLANATSAEFVVSKAVRDGVIDATIFHKERYVQSHDLVDVYATTEPMEAFHRRIAYCLTTHNDAVRSMRYPPDEYKKQLEASRGMRGKKDDKTDEEKAQELEDELEDDY
jgi:26S proteasome regulatory subunit N3